MQRKARWASLRSTKFAVLWLTHVGRGFARIDDGCGDWVRAHEALSRLAKERAAADAEEGRWLLCALRSAAHVHLGFGSFAEYVERLFGYTGRARRKKSCAR
jgi:hypothetical protein